VNNEEAPQAVEVTEQALSAAPAEAPARDDEEADEPGVDRWHAVTSQGLLSAHTKSELKAKLKAIPAAQIVSVIRGKQCSLQTSVSF
jgi:hypothetical protein